MSIFFQVLRGVFYFFTLLIGIFLLRGDIIFGDTLFNVVKEILMPGYLLFCGIMIGYLIAVVRKGKELKGNEIDVKNPIFTKSFIIGIGIGIVLALSYFFI